MSCMCGDTHCWSCGPAQGNWKCPICRAWADDCCEHIGLLVLCGHCERTAWIAGDSDDSCPTCGENDRMVEVRAELKPEFEEQATALAEAEAEAAFYQDEYSREEVQAYRRETAELERNHE